MVNILISFFKIGADRVTAVRRSPSALTEGDAGADGRRAHLLLVLTLDGNAAMPLCVGAVSKQTRRDFASDERLGRERGENKTLCVVPTRLLGGCSGGPSIVRANRELDSKRQ